MHPYYFNSSPIPKPEDLYQYPQHLRESLVELPNTPGVYTFHGENSPLYIGKSVTLRNRVLAHFRTAKEARLLQQTRKVTFISTAGELGALLLEASMIKIQQPLFNKRLRKNRQLCSLKLCGHTPQVVYAKEIDFSHTSNLFGLFAHRHRALEVLHQLADQHHLCLVRLGLENRPPHQRCFRASLGRCSGVCCGEDSPASHDARLMLALDTMRINCWPWRGAVAVVEESDTLKQFHIINNWFYLGTVDTLSQAAALIRTRPGFDSDGYKILCGPLLSERYPIISLT